MSKVIPFCGLRYNPAKFSDINSVIAPPFEIISKADEERLFKKSDYNISRISTQFKNENSGTAEEIIKQWAEHDIFIRESEPALYIHEQIFNRSETPRSVKGVIGLVKVEDYDKKIIFPHEQITTTVNNKILNFWNNTRINPCQIWSFYSDEDNSAESLIVSFCETHSPDITFTTDDNILQKLWIVKDCSFISEYCRILSNKQLFIAEGHHKYETALKFRNEKRFEQDSANENSAYNYTMMTMTSIEHNSFNVLPIHRLVKVGLFDENTLINNLTMDFSISKIYLTDSNYDEVILSKLSSEPGEKVMGLYTGGNYYYFLKLTDAKSVDDFITDKSDCFRQLDVTILNYLILKKQLTRSAGKLSHEPDVSYTLSAAEAIEQVKSGKYQCAFLLNPSKLSEIKSVSLAGERLPRFSAYFQPKVPTGLVLDKMDF